MDAHNRSFRFGVLASGTLDPTAAGWMDRARGAEADGCSTLLVGDHFLTPLACTARLPMAATVTTTLRLGSYVYCNDFRHPASLAKEAAELDRLTDGRFELGIGAGWLKEEYDMVGLRFDPGKVRADRFEEAVGIVRRLLAGETITHHGDHYTIKGYTPADLPIQKPVPLLLGGGGPRMIRFAGRQADIIGFDPASLPEGGKNEIEFGHHVFEERLRVLEEACVGRPDGGPERSVLVFDMARTLEDMRQDSWMAPEVAKDSPYALIGDTSAMVETILERRERWGISYYVFFEEDFDMVKPVIATLAGV